MAWRVWSDQFLTADATSLNMFQTIRFNDDLIVRAFRTWLVHVGSPAFTGITMKIYSNEVVSGKNTPKKLLHTSTNTLTSAQLYTLAHGVKEVWFEFDYPVFNGGDWYNIVLNIQGYTYAEFSHLGWMKAFPDPVYATGYTPNLVNLLISPYQIYCIGAPL